MSAARLPSEQPIVDIGRKTIAAFKEEITKARTVFVNGPSGVFEKPESELGTRELWHHVAALASFSVLGGGDSISAVNKYKLGKKFSYISTGGGALVRFLSGDELPVIKALKKAALKFKT